MRARHAAELAASLALCCVLGAVTSWSVHELGVRGIALVLIGAPLAFGPAVLIGLVTARRHAWESAFGPWCRACCRHHFGYCRTERG